MANTSNISGRWLPCLIVVVTGATFWAMPWLADAAVVVSGSAPSEETVELPGLTPGLEAPLPRATSAAAQPQTSPSAAPAYRPQAATATAAPAAGPQALPLPPTYAPGSPASSAATDASLYGGLPTSPTGFGLYGSNTTPPAGQGGMTVGLGQPGAAAPAGGMGFGAPPQPTPVSPLGAAPPDPTYGRYQPNNIQESTAPRQPAQVGESRQKVMRGNKPFSGYRQPAAYSPYMGMFRDEASAARGINNYYEYVRPQLESQQQSQEVNQEIRGLQDTARYGSQITNQRPGNVVPNAGTQRAPATFMQYQQYYFQGRR